MPSSRQRWAGQTMASSNEVKLNTVRNTPKWASIQDLKYEQIAMDVEMQRYGGGNFCRLRCVGMVMGDGRYRGLKNYQYHLEAYLRYLRI